MEDIGGENDWETIETFTRQSGLVEESYQEHSASNEESPATSIEQRRDIMAQEEQTDAARAVYSTVERFPALIQRQPGDLAVGERNCLEFYADMRLTPFDVNGEIYQVLASAPGLVAPDFRWAYSIVSHGKLSHSWSLLKTNKAFETTSAVTRPISILQTYGKNISMAESVIIDLENPLDARSIRVVHYYDSWNLNGMHVGFKTDPDYLYEWLPLKDSFEPSQSTQELYLWRTNLNGRQSVVPVARIVPQALFKNPVKKDQPSPLWCVELDVDRISPSLALISAFSLKQLHAKMHSWFARKANIVPNPTILVNFAFQDDGRVLQRSQKFWGDWEDSRVDRDGDDLDPNRILVVKVFNKSYLMNFQVPPDVIRLLNHEASRNVAKIRNRLSIYG